ncbi:DUF2381 family protein [Haliangium ochraceum]|uniref:DUF2381 family protein n=1 Tax=Haliangium ochraceum (strain DSM 14365 / JCM 11303 / SMP-2) TaxID=502025 RepID=D0LPQ5_HALO1|nr:DUF2381 family protein [Haliangium ochraceum]ACY15418.1 hypothetical protein Hoch_2898 [Haliangium ochraceum DSM 14365]
MTRPLIVAAVIGSALAWHGSAQAQHSQAVAPAEPCTPVVLIERTGTCYAQVDPRFVTTLYFPRMVTSAVSSDERYFRASIVDDSVIVRPARDIDADALGNLSITAGEMKVSIMLGVAGHSSEVLPQIDFRALSEAEVFDARVAAEAERLHQDVKREYERRHRELEGEVTREATQLVGERLLQRHEPVRIDAIARNDDNVIVRVERGVWVGHELYLFFTVQNRSGTPYRVTHVGVFEESEHRAVADAGRAGQVEFDSAAPLVAGLLGTVRVDQFGRGVVHVRDARGAAGRRMTLRVSEERGERPVSVGGLSWR